MTMVTKAEIVAKAREYVGTPFHHQARMKGVGVDCVGLLFGVGRDLGLAWRDVGAYPDVPDPTTMRRLIGEQMNEIPVEGIEPKTMNYAELADALQKRLGQKYADKEQKIGTEVQHTGGAIGYRVRILGQQPVGQQSVRRNRGQQGDRYRQGADPLGQ